MNNIVTVDSACRCFCSSTCNRNYDSCPSVGTCIDLDDFRRSLLKCCLYKIPSLKYDK